MTEKKDACPCCSIKFTITTMSSKAKADPEEEKRVKDIIDALKSEGLFDQFRKECLADVDTKVEQSTNWNYNEYILYYTLSTLHLHEFNQTISILYDVKNWCYLGWDTN